MENLSTPDERRIQEKRPVSGTGYDGVGKGGIEQESDTFKVSDSSIDYFAFGGNGSSTFTPSSVMSLAIFLVLPFGSAAPVAVFFNPGIS